MHSTIGKYVGADPSLLGLHFYTCPPPLKKSYLKTTNTKLGSKHAVVLITDKIRKMYKHK